MGRRGELVGEVCEGLLRPFQMDVDEVSWRARADWMGWKVRRVQDESRGRSGIQAGGEPKWGSVIS